MAHFKPSSSIETLAVKKGLVLSLLRPVQTAKVANISAMSILTSYTAP